MHCSSPEHSSLWAGIVTSVAGKRKRPYQCPQNPSIGCTWATSQSFSGLTGQQVSNGRGASLPSIESTGSTSSEWYWESDKEPQSLGERACPACVIPSEAIFWSTKPRWYTYVVRDAFITAQEKDTTQTAKKKRWDCTRKGTIMKL